MSIHTLSLFICVYYIFYYLPYIKVHEIFESTFIEIRNIQDANYVYMILMVVLAFYNINELLKKLYRE